MNNTVHRKESNWRLDLPQHLTEKEIILQELFETLKERLKDYDYYDVWMQDIWKAFKEAGMK